MSFVKNIICFILVSIVVYPNPLSNENYTLNKNEYESYLYKNILDDGDKIISINPSKAIEHFQKIIKYCEQDKTFNDDLCAKAYFKKSYCEGQLKKYDDAQKNIEIAINYNPKNPFYFSELGWIFQQKQEWKKSFDAFQNSNQIAIKMNYQNWIIGRTYNGLGYALKKQGKLKEAKAMYEKAVKYYTSGYYDVYMESIKELDEINKSLSIKNNF